MSGRSITIFGTAGDMDSGNLRRLRDMFYNPQNYELVSHNVWEQEIQGRFIPAYPGLTENQIMDRQRITGRPEERDSLRDYIANIMDFIMLIEQRKFALMMGHTAYLRGTVGLDASYGGRSYLLEVAILAGDENPAPRGTKIAFERYLVDSDFLRGRDSDWRLQHIVRLIFESETRLMANFMRHAVALMSRETVRSQMQHSNSPYEQEGATGRAVRERERFTF